MHSSHARPNTKAIGQLVGIADYMDTSLEVNDNHTMHMYILHIYKQYMDTCNNKIQTYRHDVLTYGYKHTNVIGEPKI